MRILVYFLCIFPLSTRPYIHTSISGCYPFNGAFTECVPFSECSLYLNRGVLLKDHPKPCSTLSKSELHVCCPKKKGPRYECGNPHKTLYSAYGFGGMDLPLSEARPGRPVSLFQRFNTHRLTRNTLGDRDLGKGVSSKMKILPHLDPYDRQSPQVLTLGVNSELGKWPWMALFGFWSFTSLSSWFCGGTLISPDYVLTAAHCTKLAKSPNTVVRIGDHDLSTNSEVLHQQRYISRVIVHEQYFGLQNDIALVKLQRPVQLTDAVRPICLPEPNTSHEPGQLVSVAGWGSVKSGRALLPDVLQEASLKLLDETECESIYRQFPDFNKKFPGGFQATKLCAVSADDEPRGSCNGDSGGPLMIRNPVDGMFELVGVVSAGVGCGHPDYPDIYTKVSAYVNWIVLNAT